MVGVPDWAVGVGFIILAGSVAKALSRRFTLLGQLAGPRSSRRDLAQTLDHVQRRLGELEDAQRRLGEGDDVQARLSEVEERLDFAERMLAKQREAERSDSAKH